MARGWESKSVESQMDSAESQRSTPAADQKRQEEMARGSARHSLELTRTRVLNDLEHATHDRYREILRKALAHIDAELAKLA
jgi:hypothetical protein